MAKEKAIKDALKAEVYAAYQAGKQKRLRREAVQKPPSDRSLLQAPRSAAQAAELPSVQVNLLGEAQLHQELGPKADDLVQDLQFHRRQYRYIL